MKLDRNVFSYVYQLFWISTNRLLVLVSIFVISWYLPCYYTKLPGNYFLVRIAVERVARNRLKKLFPSFFAILVCPADGMVHINKLSFRLKTSIKLGRKIVSLAMVLSTKIKFPSQWVSVSKDDEDIIIAVLLHLRVGHKIQRSLISEMQLLSIHSCVGLIMMCSLIRSNLEQGLINDGFNFWWSHLSWFMDIHARKWLIAS